MELVQKDETNNRKHLTENMNIKVGLIQKQES